ncbi:MAG TPA: UvrD-helicase domain-containing protein [Sandaracinaceae bacterium]
MPYELAFSQHFWKSLETLDARERAAVVDTVEKVQAGLPSVNVHALESVPFVSFCVNRDAMRVICHREGNLLVLLHVADHDSAYVWARRHRVATVGSYVRIVRSSVEDEAAPPAPRPERSEGPLAAVSDAELRRLDVNPPTAALLRSVPDADALLDLLTHFPPARGAALLDLAMDPDRIDAIEESYRAALARPAEAPSFAEALRDEANASEFWMPDPADEAYRRALRGDFEAWRVFLHPAQRQVARMSAKGAVKVTGGPGTGKTVVALHRAKHLAETVGGTVLLTTFNNVLTKQLGEALDRLCGPGSEVRGRIVTRSLTAVAQDVLRAAHRPCELIADDDECWQRALAHDVSGRGRRFYESERESVIAAAGAWTEEEYLKLRRTGRGTRLDRAGRREVFRVIEAYEAALAELGGGDGIALAREATGALLRGEVRSPYAAVVCDEIQDVGASELRFLAALATDPERGELRPNGLTICGDGLQRIYRVPVSLRECGIDVRGAASRVLRLNYRTTEEIRRAAVAVVAGVPADELEDAGRDPLRGNRSLRRGVPPEERQFDTPEAEADWIAEVARSEAARLLVLARKRGWLARLRELLTARGLAPRMLESGDPPSGSDALVLCTLHRAKGLEAPRVIIAGRQLVPARYPGGGDPADRALWERRERSLLYVGITRARDWCGISRVG